MNDDADLRGEIERLREEVDALRHRLERLEGSSDGTGGSSRSNPSTAEPSAADRSDEPTGTESRTGDHGPPPADRRDATTAAAAAGYARGSDAGETGGDEPSNPPTEDGSRESSGTAVGDHEESSNGVSGWERTFGTRWLGLAGALALVVGVVLFVRLAVEMGLLGKLGRVIVGTVGGLLLFGSGRYVAGRQGYVRWGRIAAGTGLAVAYFSCYAAYGYESYRQTIGTPLWAVLGALTLLVAVTAVVSVRDGAPLVAGEAFLLGYVTGALSLEAATLVVTPVYVVVLACGLVAVATVAPWSGPVAVGALATYGVLGSWIVTLDPPSGGIALAGTAAFLTFLAGGVVLRVSDRMGVRRYRLQVTAVTAVNAIAAAWLLERAGRGLGLDGVGPATVAIGLAGAYAVSGHRSARRDAVAAAGSVVFLAAGIGMAVGPIGTTVGLLALVVGTSVLSRTVRAPAFRTGAHGVAAALVPKLFVVDAAVLPAFDGTEPTAALTSRLGTIGLSICVLYALAWWFSTSESALTGAERGDGDFPTIVGAYAAAGTTLAVVALALELSGVGVSIAWASFGVVLLGIGLFIAAGFVRVLGFGVLVLAIGKVFLYDTIDLDAVPRMLSFLVLGAMLLTTSYVYARSRDGVTLDLEL